MNIGEFHYLIYNYIKNNKNELKREIVKKSIKKYPDNFEFLLDYCTKFPNFYLDPEIIEFAIRYDDNNYHRLIEYYNNNIPDEIQEVIINIDSYYIFNIVKYYGYDIYPISEENKIHNDNIILSINDNFISIACFKNFTSEIINGINFNDIKIKEDNILNEIQFLNLIYYIKEFIYHKKININENFINNIFDNIFISKIYINFDLYKQELLK